MSIVYYCPRVGNGPTEIDDLNLRYFIYQKLQIFTAGIEIKDKFPFFKRLRLRFLNSKKNLTFQRISKFIKQAQDDNNSFMPPTKHVSFAKWGVNFRMIKIFGFCRRIRMRDIRRSKSNY